jgi:hypothetical protein
MVTSIPYGIEEKGWLVVWCGIRFYFAILGFVRDLVDDFEGEVGSFRINLLQESQSGHRLQESEEESGRTSLKENRRS